MVENKTQDPSLNLGMASQSINDITSPAGGSTGSSLQVDSALTPVNDIGSPNMAALADGTRLSQSTTGSERNDTANSGDMPSMNDRQLLTFDEDLWD